MPHDHAIETIPPASAAFSRRQLLGAAAVAGTALAGGLGARRVWAAETRPLTLTWNANAICLVPVPVAEQLGFFKKHGLKVELVNFSGSTDALLEAISPARRTASSARRSTPTRARCSPRRRARTSPSAWPDKV